MAARLVLLVTLASTSLAISCSNDADCDALTSKAFGTLDEVIRAAQGPCTQDSDCIVIGHSSNCHDSCARVVLGSSLEAISETRTAINENQCREFSNAGCELRRPPCEPPGTPACVDGMCIDAYD